jgi:hypothetical protein
MNFEFRKQMCPKSKLTEELRNEFNFLFVDESIHPKKMTGNCIIARRA